jgi:putative ABC transport system permease protein
MTRLRVLAARLVEQLRRRRVDADLDDELRAHLDHLIDDGQRRGLSAAAARQEALRALGGLDQIREAVGDRRGFRGLGTLWTILRHSVRLLAKSPGFTVAAVVTLALGIGANTAIFSLVDAALLRPLPYHEPGALVSIWEITQANGQPQRIVVAPADYEDYRRAPSAAAMATYTGSAMTLTEHGDPIRLTGELVSASYFDVLGVAPALGRPLLPSDNTPGQDRVVVLSHAIWRERLGGTADAIRQTVVFNDERYEVVGVMPPDFLGASSYRQQTVTDFWIPSAFSPEIMANRGEHLVHAIARLAPGRTLAGLSEELESIASGFPLTPGGVAIGVGAAAFHDDVARDVRPLLLFLLGAVGLILLLACINVAGLVIVRSLGRRREIAVRFALGASRLRVAAELVVPSLLLAALGAAAGWVLAIVVKDALVRLAPTTIPRLGSVALDARVLAFTSLVTTFAGVAFSLLPAWQLSRTRPIEALAATSRVVANSWAIRSRTLLVGLEVAVSTLLLIGAGLMIRSLATMNGVELGFRTDHVLTTSVQLPQSRYRSPASRVEFFDELATRVAQMPGVRSVAFANRLPLRGAWTSGLIIEPEGSVTPSAATTNITAGFQSVSPGYFSTLGVRLQRGRLLDDRDRDGAMPVAVVNEAFSAALLNGADPIGRRLRRFAAAPAITIVGVVGNMRRHGPRFPVDPEVYLAARQASVYPLPLSEFALRVDGDAASFAPSVRAAILAIDDRQPPGAFRTLDKTRAIGQAAPRFQVFLLTMFAGLALTLAVVGIYGMVAYTVTQRTSEIGLRVALGAERGMLLRWLIGHSLRPVAAGAAIGLAVAAVLARWFRSFLFEISPADPWTYAGTATLLVLAAIVASFAAARKSTSIDPIAALR